MRHCVNSFDCYEGNLIEIIGIAAAVLVIAILIKRMF